MNIPKPTDPSSCELDKRTKGFSLNKNPVGVDSVVAEAKVCNYTDYLDTKNYMTSTLHNYNKYEINMKKFKYENEPDYKLKYQNFTKNYLKSFQFPDDPEMKTAVK